MSSFAALLRERAKDLSRHLAAAIKGEMRGVHQGRVASRRLRESLPAAGTRGAVSRARKSFREVTRALGPVRELDVALAHLEQGLQGARVSRVAINRVRAHVAAERERRRERMLARLERVDIGGALDRVEHVAGAAPPDGSTLNAQAVGRRVHARAFALQRAIETAGTLYHPDRLHAVRIAGKKLRYALEIVQSTSAADVGQDLRLLRRVQECLGVMHDYQVLLEHVAAVADATRRGSAGATGLRRMAVAYDRECRKLHADYLKMAPDLAASARKLRRLTPKVRNTSRMGAAGLVAGRQAPARPARASRATPPGAAQGSPSGIAETERPDGPVREEP